MSKPHNYNDLTGKKFGQLTVLAEVTRVPKYGVKWHCECKCGATSVVRGDVLRAGMTISCGCANPRSIGDEALTHGLSRTPEYLAWVGAKQRCFNKNCKKFDDYGGRGIVMCAEWRDSFADFFADMGPRPEGMSLDRIDVNGNYEPGNCRWATALTQMNNRRCTPAHRRAV